MRLVEQWSEILADLPRGWDTASLTLILDDPAKVERAALFLGPAAPVRSNSTFRLEVHRRGEGAGTSAELLRRLLERLDADGETGRLELVGHVDTDEAVAAGEPAAGSLAGQWRALLESLPEDWSHLLAQIDLDSSDFAERAALDCAPANPVLERGGRSLRFRAARRVGYGVAAEMAGRCLERLDRDRITGRVSLVHLVSDSRPVATQGGPVWKPGARLP